MGRKLPMLVLLLWSPLALGSLILIIMALAVRTSPSDTASFENLLWSGALGFGGLTGYISGWLFVSKLSPQRILRSDEDYTLIGIGIAIGMVTCLVMFLQPFFYIGHGDVRLDQLLGIATITLIPFFTGLWALAKIAGAKQKAAPD